jgi:hypothetical protein
MAHVIIPKGYGPTSQQAARTTVRSATRCASIWLTGVSVALAALMGIIFGILGGITGAMNMAAGALLVMAGRIAEGDRKAKRRPGGGSGSGAERGLGWYFFLAVLLLVIAACYGVSQMPAKQ